MQQEKTEGGEVFFAMPTVEKKGSPAPATARAPGEADTATLPTDSTEAPVTATSPEQAGSDSTTPPPQRSPATQNPEYTLHQLPLDRLFTAIRREYLKVERVTMNTRQYNFTTSLRYQPWNRYMNILAIEETIFPPTQPMPSPDPQMDTRRGSEGAVGGASPPRAGGNTRGPGESPRGMCGIGAAVGRCVKGTLGCSPPMAGAVVSPPPPFPYIDGNLVRLPDVEPAFVTCQAPLPNGLEDFYRTIWHYRIGLVFMLTQVVEGEMLKADRYWPPDRTDVEFEAANAEMLAARRSLFARDMNACYPPHEPGDGLGPAVPYGDHILQSLHARAPRDTLVFGSMSVQMDIDAPYRYDPALKLWTRPLIVQPASYLRRPPGPPAGEAAAGEAESGQQGRPHSPPPLRVLQVQYTGWPDHGVPTSTDSFNRLLEMITEYMAGRTEAEVPPVLVHCSAGIGRTGSLIGAYAAVQLMEQGLLQNDSLASILLGMRQCRYGMVQRIEQYLYVYGLVLSRLGFADMAGYVAGVPEQALRYQSELEALRQSAK